MLGGGHATRPPRSHPGGAVALRLSVHELRASASTPAASGSPSTGWTRSSARMMAEFDPRPGTSATTRRRSSPSSSAASSSTRTRRPRSSPAYRLSVYDTDNEAERAGLGRRDEDDGGAAAARRAAPTGATSCSCSELALDPPWPAYDEFAGTPEALAEQVLDARLQPGGGHRLRGVQVGAAARGRDRGAPRRGRGPRRRARSSSHDRALGQAGGSASASRRSGRC